MRRQQGVVDRPTRLAISANGMSAASWRQSRILLSNESSDVFATIGLSLEWISTDWAHPRKASNPIPAMARRIAPMLRRFTDPPATVNETYFQHMAMAFGFGGRMLLGSLACFVHGFFPWLCRTRGSD